MTLYTDTGIPADRINVSDIPGGLGSIAAWGQPLWLPAGPHVLPSNISLDGAIDIACDPLAEVTLSGSNFISNGAGTLKWRGGKIRGDGNDALVSLNAATEIPALIDIQDTTLIGASEVNWAEFKDDGLPLIGRLVLKRNTLDMLGIGRGTFIQNGVAVTEIEDYEVKNFTRFGLLIGVFGRRQQDLVQSGTFKRLHIHDGRPDGGVNGNALYLAGRNYEADDVVIERFLHRTAADVPNDGSDGLYTKVINLRLSNIRIVDVRGNEGYLTIKGQSWDGLTGPGPRGGINLVENVWIERTGTAEVFAGGIGIADQSRGSIYRNITTVGLTGQALVTHQTSGPVIVQNWNDYGRDPADLIDPGKGVFHNRSDLGDAGVMTIMGSSVQPEFLTRATPPNPPPGRIIHDEFGNNWN